jgi:microcystin-dependent protein
MATTLNAGTTTGTSLQITTDTTGAMNIQTSGTNAISISSAQVVSLANPLLPASGGTGVNSLGTGVATALGQNVTGSGSIVLTTSPSMASPTLTGTPVAPTATVGTNTTQIATTAFVQTGLGTVNSVITGTIQMWPTTSAPSGYLLCDGTAVSRTTYATLFGVVGTTFGTGDGSTTFNLPNYVDRMPIGKGTIAASIGATGGSKDAVVVSHTHTLTDPGHSHSANGDSVNNGGIPTGLTNSSPSYTGPAGISISTAFTGITLASAGTSGTNANLPPYLSINFIIKT